MNKLFRNVALVAFGFGMAATFTACHNGEDTAPTIISNMSSTVSKTSDIKTLVLTFAQKPNSVTFAGKTGNIVDKSDGTYEVVFEDIETTSGVLNVDFGTSFETYSQTINFGKADALEVVVPAIRKATQTMNMATATADASGNFVVTNDTENQNDKQFGADNSNASEAQIAAEIVVPATTTKQDGSAVNEDFSIVVFTPEQTTNTTNEDALVEGKSVNEKVLGIKCEPDGVKFNAPVTVNVTIPEASGYNLSLKHETTGEVLDAQNGKLSDKGNDVFSAQVPHFSTWLYFINAKITKIESVIEKADEGTTEVANGGKSRISYKKNVGYEVIGNAPAVIKQYLASVFSVKKRQINSTFSFTAPASGTATWFVNQAVRTYSFVSGSKSFKVRFYGSVTPQVTYTGNATEEQVEEAINTHSGGTN